MPGVQLKYSKTQVNRAGDLLRAAWTTDDWHGLDMRDVLDAADLAYHFRSCHNYPLTKVTMGIRSMVSHESSRVIVGQRFKRFPSIINKLVRYPDMSLSRMQDIGGCRAIVNNGYEVQKVLRRIRKNWKPPDNRVRDYVKTPAPSGYRGVHVIVERDERMVEVQLRTPLQHEWAIAVERMGARTGFDLKSGVGPSEVLDFFAVASEGMEIEESGGAPDDSFLSRYDEARRAAAPWMTGGN
ncbi:MAG: RelA/SpoT domain-containing protein [Actinomycetota bacterium]|nr:RelA/SpoT domain-containing protein [Actinomycetota bacterium]